MASIGLSNKRVLNKQSIRYKNIIELNINIFEIVRIFKEIQGKPEKIFAMIRFDIKDSADQFLSELIIWNSMKKFELKPIGKINIDSKSQDNINESVFFVQIYASLANSRT